MVDVVQSPSDPRAHATALLRLYDSLEIDRFAADPEGERVVTQLEHVRGAFEHNDPMRAECVIRILNFGIRDEAQRMAIMDDALACARELGTGSTTSRLMRLVAGGLRASGHVERAVAILEDARAQAIHDGREGADVMDDLHFALRGCVSALADKTEQERVLRVCLEYTSGPPWFESLVTDDLVKHLKKEGRHREASALEQA
jgi:hypothetical protein